MPPELDDHGNPIPTEPLSDERVTGMCDALIRALERDPQHCEAYMSAYRGISVFQNMIYRDIAERKILEALRVHQGAAGGLFNHTPGCNFYVNAYRLFDMRSDENN